MRSLLAKPWRLLLLLASSLVLLVGSAPAIAAQSLKSDATSISPASARTEQPSAPETQASTASTTASVNDPAQHTDSEKLSFMDSEHSNSSREAVSDGPSAFGLMARTLGALLLIVGLIVAAAWGMRRLGGARFGAPNPDAPELTVLSTVGLGDRRSLAVVRFGQRTLLVGSTAQNMTLLATEDWNKESVAPPIRSVADLLNEDATMVFNEELSIAAEQLDRAPLDWHEGTGAA